MFYQLQHPQAANPLDISYNPGFMNQSSSSSFFFFMNQSSDQKAHSSVFSSSIHIMGFGDLHKECKIWIFLGEMRGLSFSMMGAGNGFSSGRQQQSAVLKNSDYVIMTTFRQEEVRSLESCHLPVFISGVQWVDFFQHFMYSFPQVKQQEGSYPLMLVPHGTCIRCYRNEQLKEKCHVPKHQQKATLYKPITKIQEQKVLGAGLLGYAVRKIGDKRKHEVP